MTALPEDWSKLTLLDHLKRPATYGVVKAGAFVSSGIPMLRGGDIKAGRISFNLPQITPRKDQEYARTRLETEDVVVALVGYPGESAIVPKRLSGANISRAVGLLRLSGKLRPDYLVHFLNSAIGRAEFLRPGAGSAQMVVNLKDLNKLEVPCPPTVAEQEAIAEALSDADALIEGLERLIAKKRCIKQGAMQDLLTAKRRLPGFSGEWVETSFGQCFQFMRTGSASRSQLGTNLGVGYIHYGDIHGLRSSVLDLSRTRLPEIAPGKVATLSRVRDGDLVIADASEDITDVGKSVEVRGVGGAAVVAGLHTFLLRGHPDIVADGFKGYLQFLRDVRAGIESIATGSSVYGISKKNLAELKFRVPPVDEQAAIGWLFHDMDAEIQALETRLDKARQVKEGMMQKLLTGRIRLV